ncbi:nucleotidyltransferase domain-containing protein [Mucilaginibacter terrigena]|uniref:Nucleotidyltransferase domain-containing protein n=1 Tax=Mucilaginibacter terrigena TaxID=2492395 RepID=A0A4V1ZCD7_9SPHI|nr:nucleotidyltransferase domain-containing protein [Mucilaginibacter terrigena]RYU92300.1 nucleotidyltransferase domain-containing protein [Mucilaginibacter terrigena]
MLHPTFKAQLPAVLGILKAQGIKSAYAFGSVVSDNFNENSDIDLLIGFDDELEPLKKGEICWDIHDKLRALFEREVDILVEGSLKNPFFIEEINEKKQLIYAA